MQDKFSGWRTNIYFLPEVASQGEAILDLVNTINDGLKALSLAYCSMFQRESSAGVPLDCSCCWALQNNAWHLHIIQAFVSVCVCVQSQHDSLYCLPAWGTVSASMHEQMFVRILMHVHIPNVNMHMLWACLFFNMLQQSYFRSALANQ